MQVPIWVRIVDKSNPKEGNKGDITSLGSRRKQGGDLIAEYGWEHHLSSCRLFSKAINATWVKCKLSQEQPSIVAGKGFYGFCSAPLQVCRRDDYSSLASGANACMAVRN
jgi:hypothetical protein